KRPSANEDLVHEFYANLTSNELTEVSVRGIKVPISSNAINEFFELPNFEDDGYSSLMRNIEAENLQEILKELTILGSKWTVSKNETHIFRREYLTPIAKSAEIPDKAEPMDPITEPDMATLTFRTQSPYPNLRDELSKLMDVMQHMQWQ
ncbi:hypothetical protein Goshw_023672, partial [Gossypium schwendimanii]|nr:hypothetical protein [Gossypium schwendimanii]